MRTPPRPALTRSTGRREETHRDAAQGRPVRALEPVAVAADTAGVAETPLAFHRHALTRPTGLRRRLLAELLLQHDDGAVESRLTTRDLVPGQYVAARGGHWLVVR